MRDKLTKTWGYHVHRGGPFWRIQRLWWKARYRFYAWMEWDPEDLDPEWLRRQKKIRPP